MDDFHVGYPNLAAFQSCDESLGLYRRFAYVQSRLLLEKQDILRVLEKRLDEYDDEHIASSVTRNLRPDPAGVRKELLRELEQAFNSYGKHESSSLPYTEVLTIDQLPSSPPPSS